MIPALRKPHRVAFLIPVLAVDGSDAPNAAETGLLVWMACIEVCQRHPGLAVLDAEATPLVSQDGHFTPEHARPGATPGDSFYGPTRCDELIWLELALPRTGPVRLHAVARDGRRETFDGPGRSTGEQIHHAIERWLASRGLGALPRRFEAFDGAELLAAARVFAPLLAEQARIHVQIEAASGASLAEAAAVDRSELRDGGFRDLGEPGPAAGAVVAAAAVREAATRSGAAGRRPGRALAGRLTATLRAPALRLIGLALREDLDDVIRAADPEQPQALFAQFCASLGRGRDLTLLRRILTLAPGWALPYGELTVDVARPVTGEPPSELEALAAAGIAALCRPGQLAALHAAAVRLADDGQVDCALRLMKRAVDLHPDLPQAHIALLALHRRAGRPGAWLAQAQDSGTRLGCPLDPALPWYPEQIQIDLAVADALLHAGRLAEAIALRASRLDGRAASWPRHTQILARWRRDPALLARSFARDGHLRGDPGRVLAGYRRGPPDEPADLAFLLDALVAVGCEAEVALAWAQFGPGRRRVARIARLAAARGLLAAGDWRRGIEELWRLELTEPGGDVQTAVARAGRILSRAPIEALEAALAERVAAGATTLARRMARDIADFAPGAARSSIVLRALGKTTAVDFDPAWLAGFTAEPPARRAIDALFAEARGGAPGDPGDLLARRDALVNRWFEVVFAAAAEDDAAAIARAAAYVAGQALGRYLAATTGPPSPLAGGYRTVAAEALALVARHRKVIADRDARALLGAVEPVLRRVDRWLGSQWLGVIEHSCAIDERAAGDIAGFAREHATVAARILGPEEATVLAASVARLCRDRPAGWAAAVAAQAARLAAHAGGTGAAEWAEAVTVLLADREIEIDDAIDALHTACYLAEGRSAVPCIHAARVLLAAGRAPGALGLVCAGLGAAAPAWRAEQLAALASVPGAGQLDVPLDRDRLATQQFEALTAGELARAEKLGRLAVALDPDHSEAHRNLGLALAHQGKVADALHHLARSAPDQATQILAGVLYQRGAVDDALAVLDYASRWYTAADQWLGHAAIAHAAMDSARAAAAYREAHRLDPGALDPSQLNAYAGALAELGDAAACAAIAEQLLRVGGGHPVWRTHARVHLAGAALARGEFDRAAELAQLAIDHDPSPEHAPALAAIRECARSRTGPPPVAAPARPGRPAAFAALELGEFAQVAARLGDPSWQVRRAALAAARFRPGASVARVASRACAAAAAILADTAGQAERDAVIARADALAIREQAYFARDPAAPLGEAMTREAFLRELAARGAPVPGELTAPPSPAVARPGFADPGAVPDGRLARVSDYVALIRDLAVLTPREALAEFDLDEAGYREVARAWAGAIAADPALVDAIASGLARR